MNSEASIIVNGLSFIPDIPGLELDKDVTALWRTLLSSWVASCCDGIGFSGIHSADDLSRVSCFEDWQPDLVGHARYHVEWDTPAAGRKASDEEFALFRLDSEALDRVGMPMFHFWSSTNPSYPADKLFFFSGDQIVLDAEPHEEGLLFLNITQERRDQLSKADPRFLEHLNQSRNWAATSSVTVEPG